MQYTHINRARLDVYPAGEEGCDGRDREEESDGQIGVEGEDVRKLGEDSRWYKLGLLDV
jgi:hypothetical protein